MAACHLPQLPVPGQARTGDRSQHVQIRGRRPSVRWLFSAMASSPAVFVQQNHQNFVCICCEQVLASVGYLLLSSYSPRVQQYTRHLAWFTVSQGAIIIDVQTSKQ